jgi:hypothetical protein
MYIGVYVLDYGNIAFKCRICHLRGHLRVTCLACLSSSSQEKNKQIKTKEMEFSGGISLGIDLYLNEIS